MFIEERTEKNEFFICPVAMVLVRGGNIMRQYRTKSNFLNCLNYLI